MSDVWISFASGGIAALIGGIVGGSLPTIIQMVREKVLGPKLVLDFDDIDDRLLTRWGGDNPFDGVLIRVRVLNSGQEPARNVRVFMINLNRYEGGMYRAVQFRDSREIPWAGWHFGARDVHHGVTFFCDVVKFDKHVDKWLFALSQPLETDKKISIYHGTYRIRMLAVADNARPVELYVEVCFEGDHNKMTAKKLINQAMVPVHAE